jgi:hypothetical protein
MVPFLRSFLLIFFIGLTKNTLYAGTFEKKTNPEDILLQAQTELTTIKQCLASVEALIKKHEKGPFPCLQLQTLIKITSGNCSSASCKKANLFSQDSAFSLLYFKEQEGNQILATLKTTLTQLKNEGLCPSAPLCKDMEDFRETIKQLQTKIKQCPEYERERKGISHYSSQYF